MKKTILEVGDRIKYENAFGSGIYTVSRVTNTLAFVKVNSNSEIKFKRFVTSLGVRRHPREQWLMTKYEIL